MRHKWRDRKKYMAIGRFEINEVCNEVMAIATNIVGVMK